MTSEEYKAREVIKNILKRHCDGKMPRPLQVVAGVTKDTVTIQSDKQAYEAYVTPDELKLLRSFINT